MALNLLQQKVDVLVGRSSLGNDLQGTADKNSASQSLGPPTPTQTRRTTAQKDTHAFLKSKLMPLAKASSVSSLMAVESIVSICSVIRESLLLMLEEEEPSSVVRSTAASEDGEGDGLETQRLLNVLSWDCVA